MSAPAGEGSPGAALAAQRWAALPARPLLLVPTGSTEQHGPHLPLDTDSVVATSVATEVARALRRRSPGLAVLVAPTVGYGASGEHEGFPGTASIGHEALALLLVELTRSMALWAGRIVFVNAHGGNVPTIAAVVSRLADEGHDVAWLPCQVDGGDAHAGRAETSLMLHLAPHTVDLTSAVRGNTTRIDELLPALVAHGVRAASPSGVLGDPSGASASEGECLLAAMVSGALLRIGGRTGGHP